MASRFPAKSILKQQSSTPKPTLSEEQQAQADKNRKNLGIALHHANLIQNQKNVQAQILSSIEALLDYPSASSAMPAAKNFTQLVSLFQPSDLDALSEERSIDGKCGYTLCHNSPRSLTLGASAAWKLKGKNAGSYCSTDCMRKALYVRTQLSEVPAWERSPGQQAEIVLLEDDGQDVPVAKIQNQAWHSALSDEELAMERGEGKTSWRPKQVMADAVVEKFGFAQKAAVQAPALSGSHTAVEGYEPTGNFGRVAKQSLSGINSDEDEGDEEVDEEVSDQRRNDDTNDEDESWRELYDSIGKG